MIAPEVELGDVCEITMGQAPAGETYNDVRRGLPLIAGAGDFGDAQRPDAKRYTSEPTKICRPGDIILSIRATIGTKVLSDQEYCLGRGVAGLRAKAKLNERYLWHWLGHAEPALSRKGRGATFPQVSRRDIAELNIPVPPIDEQQRIAAILDKADVLRQTRKRVLKLLDELTQSIVRAAYTRVDATVPLGNLFDVQGGLQLSSARAALPIEVPYLRVANVYRSRLELAEIKQMRVKDSEIRRTVLKKGDLLFVEGHGNAGEVGRCAVWDASIDGCTHQNHLIRARPSSDATDTLVLCHWLNSPDGRRHLLKRGKTTSGLNTISINDVKSAPVPLIPLNESKRARQRLDRIEEIRNRCLVHCNATDVSFASLQNLAFSGQL